MKAMEEVDMDESTDCATRNYSVADQREGTFEALEFLMGHFNDYRGKTLSGLRKRPLIMTRSAKSRYGIGSRCAKSFGLLGMVDDSDYGCFVTDSFHSQSGAIDASMAYVPCGFDPAIALSFVAAKSDGELVDDLWSIPGLEERFFDLSLNDDRKHKGRTLWIPLPKLRSFVEESLARSLGERTEASAWQNDLALRARYLRAANCLVGSLEPPSFNHVALALLASPSSDDGFAEAFGTKLATAAFPRLRALSLDLLNAMEESSFFVADEEFREKWAAYQDDARRVHCLWKGWKGPRAVHPAVGDPACEMIVAYIRFKAMSDALLPVMERMDTALLAYSGRFLGNGKSALLETRPPSLDHIHPEERRRRHEQSVRARALRHPSSSFDEEPQVGWDDEGDRYIPFGTYESFLKDPMRYPDWFDQRPMWERDTPWKGPGN